MSEYIGRTALMGKLTAADMQQKLRQMSGEDAYRVLLWLVNDAPAADVVPVVHGRWIEDHDYLKCPECGVMVKWDFTFFDIGNWNYCPNCGEKMDGKGEDDGQKD